MNPLFDEDAKVENLKVHRDRVLSLSVGPYTVVTEDRLRLILLFGREPVPVRRHPAPHSGNDVRSRPGWGRWRRVESIEGWVCPTCLSSIHNQLLPCLFHSPRKTWTVFRTKSVNGHHTTQHTVH